jgi:hypothetical protein
MKARKQELGVWAIAILTVFFEAICSAAGWVRRLQRAYLALALELSQNQGISWWKLWADGVEPAWPWHR